MTKTLIFLNLFKKGVKKFANYALKIYNIK